MGVSIETPEKAYVPNHRMILDKLIFTRKSVEDEETVKETKTPQSRHCVRKKWSTRTHKKHLPKPRKSTTTPNKIWKRRKRKLCVTLKE